MPRQMVKNKCQVLQQEFQVTRADEKLTGAKNRIGVYHREGVPKSLRFWRKKSGASFFIITLYESFTRARELSLPPTDLRLQLRGPGPHRPRRPPTALPQRSARRGRGGQRKQRTAPLRRECRPSSAPSWPAAKAQGRRIVFFCNKGNMISMQYPSTQTHRGGGARMFDILVCCSRATALIVGVFTSSPKMRFLSCHDFACEKTNAPRCWWKCAARLFVRRSIFGLGCFDLLPTSLLFSSGSIIR